MYEPENIELLREFAEHGSEAAFATLVGRHTRNPHATAGVTQTVFIILARKARGLSRRTILTGWLYQTGRLTWTKYKLAFGMGATRLLAAGVLTTATLSNGNADPPPAAVVAAASRVVTMLEEPVPAEPREPFTQSALFTFQSSPGAIAMQPDGKILVAATLGGFAIDEKSGGLGWYTRGVMRFEADGTLDRSFYCDVGRPGASSAMAARLSLLSDGRIFVSGMFDAVDGKPRHGHAILLADGRVDESFDPWRGETNVSTRIDTSRLAFSSAVLSDGTIAVLSRPVDQPGFPDRPWAAYRLAEAGRIAGPALPDASLDSARPAGLILSYSDIPLGPFPEVPLELIRYAVRLPDGGAILAVRERPIDSIMRYASLRRYDKNWRPDPGFTNQFTIDARSEVSLHLQADGKLLVAGMIGKMDGEDFPGLVRLERDGALDRSFRCETDNSLEGRVMDLKFQADGRIVSCGFFTQVNGIARQHLARLNPDGSLDRTFTPPFVSSQEFYRKRMLRVQHLTPKVTAPAPAPGSDSAMPAVSPEETVLITSLNMREGVADVQFSGRPGQVYILQARDSVNSAGWSNRSTNQAGADGRGLLRDEEAKQHPMRFYRIASP